MRVRAALLALATTALALVAHPAGAAPGARERCTDVSVPAALGPGLPRTEVLYGRLCMPAGNPPPVLQVLVHGASYDHDYWDFPGFGGRYSYVRHMLDAGYTTLAVDQLGVGRSSHPASALVTQAAAAHALHDVIQAARGGALGADYEQVVLVGHSFGSLTSWLEAATYGDVDGVLASGASHLIGAGALSVILTRARPAQQDPVTARSVPPLDFGYLSIPGARAAAFYHLPNADPAVVAQDEATRSEIPAGVGATIPVYVPATLAIDVPVLEANGVYDLPFCAQGGGGSLTDCSSDAALHASETPFFAPAAELETVVVPDAGHNLNLQLNADVFFDHAREWFERRFPV